MRDAPEVIVIFTTHETFALSRPGGWGCEAPRVGATEVVSRASDTGVGTEFLVGGNGVPPRRAKTKYRGASRTVWFVIE